MIKQQPLKCGTSSEGRHRHDCQNEANWIGFYPIGEFMAFCQTCKNAATTVQSWEPRYLTGDKVFLNGFHGSIIECHTGQRLGQYAVRLPGGVVIGNPSEFGKGQSA
jgi:hypothetical protein